MLHIYIFYHKGKNNLKNIFPKWETFGIGIKNEELSRQRTDYSRYGG